MVSDEKRHEVAARLRENHRKPGESLIEFIARVVNGKDSATAFDVDTLTMRLADVIDARANEGEAAKVAEWDKASPPVRRCLVDGERCLFHLAYVKHWTHGASPLIGGFIAGQESRLFALLEGSDGTMREVPATRVRLLDSEMSLGECRWGDALASGRKSSDDERTSRGGQQTSQSMPK